jgi:hypothetical protein
LTGFGPISRTYPKTSGDFLGNIHRQRSPPFSGPLSSDGAGDCETFDSPLGQKATQVSWSQPKALAMLLLSEMVRAAKR